MHFLTSSSLRFRYSSIATPGDHGIYIITSHYLYYGCWCCSCSCYTPAVMYNTVLVGSISTVYSFYFFFFMVWSLLLLLLLLLFFLHDRIHHSLIQCDTIERKHCARFCCTGSRE